MKDFHLKVGPFFKHRNTTNKIMIHLLIALIPIIIFNFYKNGIIPYQHGYIGFFEMFYPLLFVLIPTVCSFLIELIYAFAFLKKKDNYLKEYIRESFSIFPGLFLGLILPINTPISIVVFGSFIATFVGKLLFGGFGNNVFNPALVGRLFVISSYALVINNNGGYLNAYELDTLATATPLSNASVVSGIGTYETLVAPYGNLWNFFLGTIPGAVGEVSSLLCVIGFVYLTITKVIKWKIPVTYILTVFLITYMIGNINGLGVWYPLFQVFSGGLMFGAVFMATDPVTSPTTSIGQVLYGLFLGILTVVFRYLTPYPEGVLTSILTMNMLVFIIDKIGAKARFSFKRSLIIFLVAWLLIVGIGGFIGKSFTTESNVTDPNFDIISKEQTGDKTHYVVTQKGYSSNIKANLIIEDGVIISMEIISQNDSFYQKIEDADYITKLVSSQKNVQDLDAVSGATITSNALRQLVINTLNDYNGITGTEYSKDPDFNVVGRTKEENKVIYEVTQKSFGGDLMLKIMFEKGIIEEITVIDHSDSYFNLIIDQDYIQKLISNQQILEELDTISGATITSNSLRKAVINTKKEYENDYEK